MTQQHSLVISIIIAALIIGGSVLYSGKVDATKTSAVSPVPSTLYPTPVAQQAAPFAPAAAGAGFGCGIPAR